MQSTIRRKSVADNAAVSGFAFLVIIQVVIALALFKGHFDLGLKTAIKTIAPVMVSTLIISVANRAAMNGNHARAYSTLIFGIALVMLTAIITVKGM